MAWFRIHTSLVHNAKAQSIPGDLFKAWVNLMCLAKDGNGVVPPLLQVAFHLRVKVLKAQQILTELEKRGFLESNGDGTYTPHDWDDHQYQSDVSTKRVQAFRERFAKQNGNVSETPPDTDTDTEQNRKTISSSGDDGSNNHSRGKPEKSRIARMTLWFEKDFWPIYPRRVAKRSALKAALKALPGNVPAEIINGLKAQLPKYEAMIAAGDHASVPHAATWLNAHRWEDEIEPVPIAANRVKADPPHVDEAMRELERQYS